MNARGTTYDGMLIVVWPSNVVRDLLLGFVIYYVPVLVVCFCVIELVKFAHSKPDETGVIGEPIEYGKIRLYKLKHRIGLYTVIGLVGSLFSLYSVISRISYFIGDPLMYLQAFDIFDITAIMAMFLLLFTPAFVIGEVSRLIVKGYTHK